MAAPNLFHSAQSSFIQQDSLKHFHQQLSEKKAHLVLAKASYQKALALAEEFNQKIALAKEQLVALNNVLDTSKDDEEKQKLLLQKTKYEHFIENAPEKMAPFIQRLQQLANGLQVLENEITTIVEQVHESMRQQQKPNSPEV